MWNRVNYYDDPLLRHEMTFEELAAKIGTSGIFSGTDVDTATQSALLDYFLFDRLCDREARFLWLWRRRVNAYYPVYREQLSMWEARRAEAWFFDNYKKQTTQHDGTFTLDETTKTEILRELERILSDIFSGKTTGTGKSSGTTDHTGDTDGETAENRTGAETGKNRGFSFNYPESNYSGGVIPYDIDNNPVVEFINTQNDGLNKSNTTDTANGTSEQHDTYKDDRSDEYTQSGTTDNTDDQTTKETSEENANGTRDQNTETHWTEIVNRQGDNLNALAAELLDQLPRTDFFRQFADHLEPCFQKAFLLDELIEERGE